MTRDTIALAAISGLVGLAVLAGSLTHAATAGDSGSAAAERRFVKADPALAADEDGGASGGDDNEVAKF